MEDKYIGLSLAVTGSLAIGTSFIITKKGLIDAADRQSGISSDSYSYLKNATWWAGMVTMVVGELANFAAYTFAPAILVTPLGALSVLIGAVLASFILNERLGKLGKIGCTLCAVGTVIIVLHAPQDKEVETVDEILNYALAPGFMLYFAFVVGFSLFMIYSVGPKYGKKTPLVYISICSLVGSVSVMFIKGFGLALRLTFAGNNQLTHISTWVFALVVAVSIAVQMNYFNKALDLFSTNVVNPIYYVFFTTATSIASIILFQGFQYAGGIDTVSLVAGYIVIFIGVYLLNDRNERSQTIGSDDTGLRTGNRPSHSFLETRQSMSLGHRLSFDLDAEGNLPAQRHLPLSAISTDRLETRFDNRSNASLRSPNTPGKSAFANGRPGAHRADHVVFENLDEDDPLVIGDASDSDNNSEDENGRQRQSAFKTPPRSPVRRPV